ncbi:hypothetical protein D3C85_1191320 [compost metagenome]
MISANTDSAMPKVAFGSVVDTARKNTCSLPEATMASWGIQSTGIKSMAFIRNTQTKIVSASGAITGLRPWKLSFTLPSTKPISTSTKFCKAPGCPEVAFFAAMRKSNTKIRPSATDQPRVSTWKAQKPISFASCAVWAKPQSPLGSCP